MMRVCGLFVLCLLGLVHGTSSGYVFDLSYVDIDFCDGTNHLRLSGERTELKDFCFRIHNASSVTGTISVQLVDGESTL